MLNSIEIDASNPTFITWKYNLGVLTPEDVYMSLQKNWFFTLLKKGYSLIYEHWV